MRRRIGNRLLGFTLVELLVVIGVIALLISILLPALNKAREQSYKTKCLANVRTIGQALAIYAAENKDCVPIATLISSSDGSVAAYADDTIQNWFTYYGYWKNGNGSKPTGLGKLAGIKVLNTAPRSFYCPKEDRAGLQYDNLELNPWAYKLANPGSVSRHTYINYWCRPVAAFTASNVNDDCYMLEGYYTAAGVKPVKGWPKLSKLKSKAIISDMARCPDDIRLRHKDGINVYYANGSGGYVKWTDPKNFPGGTPNYKDFASAGYSSSGGPFGGGSAVKWASLSCDSDGFGQGVPAGTAYKDATFTSNMVYLNSNPKFPSSAGFWNWLDKSMN